MENSSIENEVKSINNIQVSDNVNHTLSNDENSAKDGVFSKSDVVSKNDKHIGPTCDGLKQNEVTVEKAASDKVSNDVGDSLSIDSKPSESSESVETNGELNNTCDSITAESSSSCNKELIDSNEEKDVISVSSNNASEVNPSLNDGSSINEKNASNINCDTEDHHSANDQNEIIEIADSSETNGNQVDVIDEVDNSQLKPNSSEKVTKPTQSTEDDKNENSSDSPEAMEVDESQSPVSIIDIDTGESNENSKSTEKVSPENDDQTLHAADDAEDRIIKDNQKDPTKNTDSVPEPQSTEEISSSSEQNADNRKNSAVRSELALSNEKGKESPTKENADPKNTEVSNEKEKESPTKENADSKNTDVSKEKEKISPTDENADPKNTEVSNEKEKESPSEENADPKNTEVLHIDENDEESEEVMDTTECDPFGQVTENTTTEVEQMEVDGTSNKDSQGDNVKIVTNVNLAEGNSTDNETAAKSQEKISTSTEECADQTDDHCIIPDSVNNEAPKTAVENTKPKFDITPVRLEKLMDPSKLASSQEKTNEVINDTESTNLTVTSRPQRRAAKKAESQIKEIVAQTESDNRYGNIEDVEQLSEPSVQVCFRCSRLRQCKYIASWASRTVYVCQDACLGPQNEGGPQGEKGVLGDKKIIKFTSKLQQVLPQKQLSSIPESIHFLRKCSQCGMHNISDDRSLTWEAMDFCNEDCLNCYQIQHGSFCASCKGNVQNTSMGKYSVRFGLEARQFCSGTCLEEFKKGLKSCSYCQQDITKAGDIVSALIGDKAQSKDFCSQSCVEKYERMSANLPLPIIQDTCTVCAQKKDVEVQVLIQSTTHSLCSDVCFMTFKFANNISDIDQCHVCKKYYEEGNSDSYFVFHDDAPYNFCSKICMNVFILFRRKIVPCSWCKVKKYNFDMIKKIASTGNCIMMCSLNCLTLYQVSANASSSKKIKCDLCSSINLAQYHLTMSDATIRNFCSYNCVMVFQTQYNKTPLTMHEHKSNLVPVPLGGPKRAVIQQKHCTTLLNDLQRSSLQKSVTTVANGLLPQLSNAAALKISSPLTVATGTSSGAPPLVTATVAKTQTTTKYIQQIIVKPPEPKEVSNKFTQCRVNTATKGVSCRVETSTQETQTDEHLKYPAIVPIPVPIYVPAPMHMFTTPFPVPVPFPLPIPVPVFLPTPRNTYKGVLQYMKEIVDKTPTNPYEADLLLMAKMVASEEKVEESEVVKNESYEDDDMHFADTVTESENFADAETSVPNNFTDDVLQMALKMATEQLSNSPTVDLEAELTSNTITPQTQSEDTNNVDAEPAEVPVETRPPRTRKRTNKSSGDAPTRKRGRQQISVPVDNDSHSNTALSQSSSDVSSPPLISEGERPDVNMCLKFTIGIRAWKQWVLTKNDQIEQAAAAANKKAKTFNLNILKLTTDELNYLLCLFVKEVRKPNGMEYAPDTVYYLCLSIQQYLFENGRIDNIFTDTFYEPFTNALDEVAKKFSEVNDATQYIVTRVEEEHLWESKQLGAHSPHVLLATLMFFNTKYFNLATLEEHMQLSFSHIMKHWKRNPNTPVGKPGSPAPNRNVVLRFYPPQAALDAPNSRKKKVYEQHENEVNPLRCPVKLYEFYLSKCPESVKQRNDVFYLQPERSCVPDSPVWYSTMPLQKELLMKMLHRIRMVKEVNISLLAS